MPRHRQPDNLLAFKGTKKRNPARHAECTVPASSDNLGEAPAHFTPEERAAWAWLASCAPERTLGKRDEPTLALAARLWASITARPMDRVRSAETARMESLLARLGLSPADASRVSVPPPPAEENPFAKFTAMPRRTPKKG